MTVRSYRTIWCDGCSDWEDVDISETVLKARRRLAKMGWRSVPGEYPAHRRKDICPRCVALYRGKA